MKDLFISDVHGEYEQYLHVMREALEYAQDPDVNLHIVGDIYDRGPSPDLVMEDLLNRENVDIQWGNHDVVWMGAALGQPCCVPIVVRICARYGNLPTLEETYGIDLSDLRAFAAATYANDPCELFVPKGASLMSPEDARLAAQVQKAIAIIQFKAEYKVAEANPDFNLRRRNLLHLVDYEKGTVHIDGADYEMLDMNFPTINPADPYAFTPEEEAVLNDLIAQFTQCELLQRHIRLFMDKGSLYKVVGNNLAYHACVPLHDDGELVDVALFGAILRGRELCDAVDHYVRAAFDGEEGLDHRRGLDLLWYLWQGAGSPLFAKSKMATFELYFCADKGVRKEVKNKYYSLLDDEAAMAGIIADFGLDPKATRLVSGHVPVKVGDGEDPMKCDGRVVIIDGGMSRTYQKTSGIGGMSLLVDGDQATLLLHHPIATGKPADVRPL